MSDRKARRKANRVRYRVTMLQDYRDDARALIARMRHHNETASSPDDRYSELSFRDQLRRLRHLFTANIKQRSAVPGRSS